MLFHINNSLISPCFAVLKTDTHNYLCPACLPDAKVIPRNPSHICLIQELYLSTKYTFKILLNFIFILNPNIAFWQFPPVKYIITKVWPNPPSCRLGGGGCLNYAWLYKPYTVSPCQFNKNLGGPTHFVSDFFETLKHSIQLEGVSKYFVSYIPTILWL